MSKWTVLINSLMDCPENHPIPKCRDVATGAGRAAKARQSKKTESEVLEIVRSLGEASCMNVAEFMPANSEKYLGSVMNRLTLKGELEGLFRNIDGRRIKLWRTSTKLKEI